MSCSIPGFFIIVLGMTFAPASNDLARWAPLIFAAIGGLALLAATVLYVHQLNKSHCRLLADLENELAERRKMETALRSSEGFYHSLVESLPQSIMRKDLEGRFTFGNQKIC